MAQQGSSLQNYNNELVKCIEDLKEKREEVDFVIAVQAGQCIHVCACR
jgi:Sjoegren syndrome nuclear autoantigen 1